MKQFVNAGLTMPVIGAEYISDAAKVAGPAYDNYMFATDWFNAANPTNPWSKLFLDSYVKEFSLEPEINAANYYEDTFAMWDIIRRVLAKGGNVKSGEELQNALIANPKFQSVYRQRSRHDRAQHHHPFGDQAAAWHLHVQRRQAEAGGVLWDRRHRFRADKVEWHDFPCRLNRSNSSPQPASSTVAFTRCWVPASASSSVLPADFTMRSR
jgi:hypothetical protein